jgi:hypothetical protein
VQILVSDDPNSNAVSAELPSGVPVWVWRFVTFAGIIILIEVLGDLAIGAYPVQWGSLEWEFVAISQALSALPLVTVGLLLIVFGTIGQRRRAGVRVVGVLMLLFALAVLASYAIFLLVVPPALKLVTQAAPRVGVMKVVAKTSLLAVGFTVLYLVAGVACLRGASTPSRR